MKNINVVAILTDGRTITAQIEGWEAAAKEVVRWADDGFYARKVDDDGFYPMWSSWPWVRNTRKGNPIARVFFGSEGINLEEHTVEGLRNDLKTGRVREADTV